MESELLYFSSSSSNQVRATRPKKPSSSLPISLLTAGKTTNISLCDQANPEVNNPYGIDCAVMSEAWEICQKDLETSLSLVSNRAVVQNSSHFVMLDEPQAVVDGIMWVMERAKKSIHMSSLSSSFSNLNEEDREEEENL
jgi:hypothetical protein